MKDYLSLHAYSVLDTFLTESVHIIEYLLTQITCCIFNLCYMIFLQLYKQSISYLYCTIWHYIHVYYMFYILVGKRIYGM